MVVAPAFAGNELDSFPVLLAAGFCDLTNKALFWARQATTQRRCLQTQSEFVAAQMNASISASLNIAIPAVGHLKKVGLIDLRKRRRTLGLKNICLFLRFVMATPSRASATTALLALLSASGVRGAAAVDVVSRDGTVTVSVAEDGHLAGVTAGSTSFPLTSGGTTLQGGTPTGPAVVTVHGASDVSVTTTLAGPEPGQEVTLTEHYTATVSSVHCEITVGGFKGAAAWTAPVVTLLNFTDASQLQLWAPWDRQSTPDKWTDPLLPSDGGLGWWTGQYYYGRFDTADMIVAPMASVLRPSADAGLSVLLDPTDPQLELEVRLAVVDCCSVKPGCCWLLQWVSELFAKNDPHTDRWTPACMPACRPCLRACVPPPFIRTVENRRRSRRRGRARVRTLPVPLRPDGGCC